MGNPASGSANDAKHASLVGTLHRRFVFGRRTMVLANHLSRLIPRHSRVLDVGCGDGTIDQLITARREDISIQGIDPLVRSSARIPVSKFDGETLPFSNTSFDVVMFVDVLHHINDPSILLREAARVGTTLLIKDHFSGSTLANCTLRLMDWIGNAHYGVPLPYNYWSKPKWIAVFDSLGLQVREMKVKLQLYPVPFSWFFDRNLHFIVRCDSPVTQR